MRVLSTGSPPRMRGKHTVMDRRADEDRITPADAGKTQGIAEQIDAVRDHPRGCGENLLYLNYEDLQVGSPPRMRGKRQ